MYICIDAICMSEYCICIYTHLLVYCCYICGVYFLLFLLAHSLSPPALWQRQLFWVSYGQNWCDKERDPSIRMAILTDEHSPDKFRVNGPLSQNLDFQKDFSCPATAKMNPPTKCSLW